MPSLASITPPSTCLASDQLFAFQTGNTEYYVQGPRPAQTSCLPDSYVATAVPSVYYSPGYCPDGYRAACSTTDTAGTHYTCCPQIGSTSFTCNRQPQDPWQSSYACASFFTGPLPIGTVKTVEAGRVTTSATAVTLSPSSRGATGTVNALGIHVARQSSDGNGRNNSSRTRTNRSLAIGVGVGVGTAVLLIVIGAYLLWRRRRARQGIQRFVVDDDEEDDGVGSENRKQGFLSTNLDLRDESMVAATDMHTKPHGSGYSLPPIEMDGLAGRHEPVELPPDNLVRGGQQRTPVAEVMGDSLPPGSTHIRH